MTAIPPLPKGLSHEISGAVQAMSTAYHQVLGERDLYRGRLALAETRATNLEALLTGLYKNANHVTCLVVSGFAATSIEPQLKALEASLQDVWGFLHPKDPAND